ncbi:MAG: dTDP-4-amino-4,6-dideoxygalactose transaminase [Chitinophagaceae bacterium]
MDQYAPIGFNRPFMTGRETTYIEDAVQQGKISGDGTYTQKCHDFFTHRYGFKKVLLTTSCTDALEMAALLLNIQAGDEVIAPAYTFVSTVNAFVLRGAQLVFADSCADHPCMDVTQLEALITPKTKAIVVVHYAGIACDMEAIMALANHYGLFVVEDAAHAIDAYYHNRPLGSFGHLATFSFHETKNIISGEGGLLVINDEQFIQRAEIIREKGTNRSQFFRGEVDKYNWVDMGSSFLPSDIIAAFLFAQLEHIDRIQAKRKAIWQHYYDGLIALSQWGIQLPFIPAYAGNNGHLFYLVCQHETQRNQLIQGLKAQHIQAVFHYLALNKSPYYLAQNPQAPTLQQAERYSNCLVRLPLFYNLEETQTQRIVDAVIRILR